MNSSRRHLAVAAGYAVLSLFASSPIILLVLGRVPFEQGYPIYLGSTAATLVATTLFANRLRLFAKAYRAENPANQQHEPWNPTR